MHDMDICYDGLEGSNSATEWRFRYDIEKVWRGGGYEIVSA